MKQHMGIWLPDHEQHLCDWMTKRMQAHPEEMVDGKATYQYHKFQEAMRHVKQSRVAIDVGAHVGLWSMHLVKRFELVYAFEPIQEHRKCYERNVPPENRLMHALALGEQDGFVTISTPTGSSGDSKVTDLYRGDTVMRTLDSILPEDSERAHQVDFIKIDCEGYELFVLRGGEELLLRNRPCIIVEQKPGFAKRYGAHEHGAVHYLQSLGATLRKEISGDFIMSWD